MAILLIILLVGVLYLYGRSVGTTLTKSLREFGIYLVVLLAVVGIMVLAFSLG